MIDVNEIIKIKSINTNYEWMMKLNDLLLKEEKIDMEEWIKKNEEIDIKFKKAIDNIK